MQGSSGGGGLGDACGLLGVSQGGLWSTWGLLVGLWGL